MPHASVNGRSFHFLEAGRGTPLVLLHGFPLDSRMWRHQLTAFADSHRVIAPDLRGFGQSRSIDPFTMESLAGDVRDLLTQIGALPCILGGLSMGGYVALAYAKLFPDDLRSLVLIDTKAEGDSPEARQGRQKMIEAVEAGGSTAAADAMLPKLLGVAHQNSSVAVEARRMIEQCPPRTILNALVALRDRPDRTCDLPTIGVPTLVIVGDQDALTPPDVARRLQRGIPMARLELISNAGHLAPMENPAMVNEMTRTFLDGCGGP